MRNIKGNIREVKNQAVFIKILRYCLLLIFINFIGCHSDDPDPQQILPLYFRLEGTAKGMQDYRFIDCSCDLIFELEEPVRNEKGVSIYSGFHGGHLSRKAVDSTGAGIALIPDVFAAVQIMQYPDGEINIYIPINENSDTRFWESLTNLPGHINNDEVTGSWICAPFDVRTDTIGIVSGTWKITPLSEE
jgi:hypothetical protein